MPLSSAEIAVVKGMLIRGDRHSDIAAYFGCNQGRIAEINTGQVGSGITSGAEHLPPPGPYLAGRSALKARETLLALRELIDDAIKDIDLWEDKL